MQTGLMESRNAERVRLGRRAAVSKAAAGLPLLDPAQEAQDR